MSYSTATFQAMSILVYIHFKTEDDLPEFLSTRAICENLGIPTPTAVKVINSLKAANLIATREGAKGGNLLVRPISEITVLDVFTAVEPNRPLFKVYHEISGDYEVGDYKDLDQLISNGIQCLVDADQAMRGSLSSVTLADLIP